MKRGLLDFIVHGRSFKKELCLKTYEIKRNNGKI